MSAPMRQPAKVATGAKASITQRAAADGHAKASVLSAETIDALADIAKRANNLTGLYAEKLRGDDGYRVIDPRTVAATAYDFMQKAAADPAPILKEQLALWVDLATLWQRTATRVLTGKPAEPVISTDKPDKRFKDEAWTADPF